MNDSFKALLSSTVSQKKTISAHDEIRGSFPEKINVRIERSSESFENHDRKDNGCKVGIEFDLVTENIKSAFKMNGQFLT